VTQVSSLSGATASLAAPVSTSKAKAGSQPQAATSDQTGGDSTHVTFGEEAIRALEGTATFFEKDLLLGVEDAGEAAYHAVIALGTGTLNAAENLKTAITGGIRGMANDVDSTVNAIGSCIVHAENAISDVWSLITTGATDATTLASTLGTDASTAIADVGVAATDVGVGANIALSGVSSTAKTAANYGSYLATTSGKVINELT